MQIELMGPGVDMGAGSQQIDGCPMPDMSLEEFVELASSVIVFVLHRPSEGVSGNIARIAGFWARFGMSYSIIEDEHGGNIDLTRANMCRAFLDIAKVHPRYRFMVMIDNDEGMEPLQPLRLCRWDRPFVSGVVCSPSEHGSIKACFTKRDRYGNVRFPTVAFTKKMPARGLIEIESAGAGLVAIRRDAIEAVIANGEIPFHIPQQIRERSFETGVLAVGEDISFCQQLARAGVPRYVDLAVRAVHYKTIAVLWPEELIDEDMDPETWEVDPRDAMHPGMQNA